ncbi:MAG: alkaline shock response membrane anchor protein AmaP [Clostridiales bacterium]|nr:alkaline shock response membrane anchor protein AmaP [Clostridiales bacterium]
MKIRPFQRILLVIESLLLSALLVLLGLCVCGVFSLSDVTELLEKCQNNVPVMIAILAVLLALVLFSVCMMFLGVKKAVPQSVFIKSGENGNVCITMQSINTLIMKHAKNIQGVTEARVYTKADPDGLAVLIKIAVMKDSVIPQVTQELQVSVKQMTAEVVGLTAKEVSVLVDNSIAVNAAAAHTRVR